MALDAEVPLETVMGVELLAAVVAPTEVNAVFADQAGKSLVQAGVTGSVPFR